MQPIEKYKLNDGKFLEIYQDDHPLNPREDFDPLGIMVCFHKRYRLGDEHDYIFSDFGSWYEIEQQIEKDNPDCIILPLYLYDHSGLTISTQPFSCRWDSGQVGFIYITKKNIDDEWGGDRKKAKNCLLAEVEEYDQYLRGDIYGFVIRDKCCGECGGPGKTLESCWGFFTSDYVTNGLFDHAGVKKSELVKV